MTSKKIVKILTAICITAILGIAVCGCDDLGAYEDTEEYYDSFGDVVLISGTSREEDDYSVEDYFYNKESREDFLEGNDGAYSGVEYSDYVYMAIPVENTIEMDTLALFLRASSETAVYMNVYITDTVPSEWKGISDLVGEEENTEESPEDPIDPEAEPGSEAESENEEKKYDDPDPETRIGEIVVYLDGEKWNSFVLDSFTVNGKSEKSIMVTEDQYILIQIRNNSGVRVLNEERQVYVDPQTGLELQKADITMTNLLVRALNVENETEVQGGE